MLKSKKYFELGANNISTLKKILHSTSGTPLEQCGKSVLGASEAVEFGVSREALILGK